MMSTEILCCIALFYQSLDFRSPAHNYVGQALRIAMAHGMHTRMPVGNLGLNAVERCRKIWWTVYILDRNMSIIQGLPQSIDDRFVETNLPSLSESQEKNKALDMHIKLCRSIDDINSTVYGLDGRINQKFLLSTKVALERIAKLADKLSESFPLHLDDTDNGISRTSAYLHLLYQQCVIIATRPLLFCFLKIRLDSLERCRELLKKSQNIRNLIQMCLDSAQHSVGILHGLKSQGLLETFLNFDLESIFISTVVLLVVPVIDHLLLVDHISWLEKAYAIFRDMVGATNKVAKFRWLELQQLNETLNPIFQDKASMAAQINISWQSDVGPQLSSQTMRHIPTPSSRNSCNAPSTILGSSLETNCGFEHILTSAEIMAMADSIEIDDSEWVSSAMMNQDVW
ncbi:hypothetical protein N7462_001654 [Penicillium macrosclerotiorum]|uniref:uncharacterized protein n=1 Tax=Penicillium macrosclerotiorum TaxID=303699 RepID=UPI00254707F1|nr:uncharacterized protein N7462_001654 [Penicillium macrosclerotiorum]KAJ5692231.1 hypothetical protein N7462_001654 [Penicillium macrosclerotiorum]